MNIAAYSYLMVSVEIQVSYWSQKKLNQLNLNDYVDFAAFHISNSLSLYKVVKFLNNIHACQYSQIENNYVIITNKSKWSLQKTFYFFSCTLQIHWVFSYLSIHQVFVIDKGAFVGILKLPAVRLTTFCLGNNKNRSLIQNVLNILRCWRPYQTPLSQNHTSNKNWKDCWSFSDM